jgi:hypothetical protein
VVFTISFIGNITIQFPIPLHGPQSFGCDVKIQNTFLLIFVVIFACSQGAKVTVRPREVLGVTLGGSVQELKAVYKENQLSLQKADEDRYVSVDAVKPLAGLTIVEVSYQISSGVLQVIKIRIRGDVSGKLQALIEEEFSTDPGLRQQLEQKQRFIGTIGENDHYWLLPDMTVMVIVKRGETRLIYSLK